jgi:hypothetical protein
MAALAIGVWPHTARAGIAIEGLYGFARPPAADFSAAVSGAANDKDLSDDSLQIAGGTLVLNLGVFELGAVVDKTFGSGVTQTALGGLVGLRIGDKLRLDLLGEAGGHRFGDFTDDPSVITASSTNEWLFYVGLRPGIAYRFDVSPGFGLLLGIWGFARWDVTDKSVPVTVGGVSGTAPGNVDLGGTSIGVTLRAGIELM